MIRTAKYVLLGVVALTLFAAAVVFFQPSLIINRSSLVRWLKSAPVTYDEIDLTVTSPGLFERAVSFSAKGFCFKSETADICLPSVALDIVFGFTRDGIKLKQIKKFALQEAKLKILKATAKAPRAPSDEEKKGTGTSLALRALETISALKRNDVHDVGIERLSFAVGLGSSRLTGELNVTRTPDAVFVDVNCTYKEKPIQLWAAFGKEIHLSVASMGRPLVTLRTDADLYAEVFEYLQSSNLYELRRKHLPVLVDVKDLGGLLELLGASQPALQGAVTGAASLNLNTPALGDAFIGFHLFGDIIDGAERVAWDADIDYDFYQKIPFVRLRNLTSSAGHALPAENYRAFTLLRDLAKQLDLQIGYEWSDTELAVKIKRDYSKLPRNFY